MSSEVSSNRELGGFVGTGTVIAIGITGAMILGVVSAMGIEVGAAAIGFGVLMVGLVFASGLRIIRPTHRANIERFGKFERVQKSGITWIIPFVHKAYAVNITEQMTHAEKQQVITKDNLVLSVSALVRYKVRDDDQSVQDSQYKVHNYERQIVELTRTTLRNVIGQKDFVTVNGSRKDLNEEIKREISEEATKWGIEILAAELKELDPPDDVQATMKKIIMAANEKKSAVDYASAAEIKADGERRAAIKNAEGKKAAIMLEAQAQKQKQLLEAQGQAEAIKMVAEAEAEKIRKINNAAKETFEGGAVLQEKYKVTQNSLQNNTKIVIVQEGIDPMIVVGNDEKVIPVKPQDSVKKLQQ